MTRDSCQSPATQLFAWQTTKEREHDEMAIRSIYHKEAVYCGCPWATWIRKMVVAVCS